MEYGKYHQKPLSSVAFVHANLIYGRLGLMLPELEAEYRIIIAHTSADTISIETEGGRGSAS